MAPDYRPYEPGSSAEKLTSWKEIATFLNISVRAAQNWERERGLPVHRLPGARSQVVAFRSELQLWLKSSQPRQTPEPRTPSFITPARVRAVCAFVLVCGAISVYAVRPKPQPANWRLEHRTLTISDENGRELWRKTYADELHNYTLAISSSRVSPVWIGDLDGDGRNEVLFTELRAGASASQSDVLICYSSEGEEKWRFEPGMKAWNFPQPFQPPFAIASVTADDFGSGGPKKIVVASVHRRWYPSQIALISATGKLEREYWHSGHIQHLAIGALDGRNKKIFAGGVANGYNSAALVVLDPNRFGGMSREDNPDYQLPGPTPVEEWRIIFPRTCLNRAAYRYNPISEVVVHFGVVEATTTEDRSGEQLAQITYTFSKSMSVVQPGLDDRFVVRHAQMFREGKLDHDWSPAEMAQLHDFRYVTGPRANVSEKTGE